MGRRIERGRLVENLDVGLQSEEGVGEADRDQQLAPVFRRQLDRDMAAKGRRRAANVDRDIEDGAAGAADELVLREGRRLEVEPAQGAGRRRIGMIVLDESEFKARLLPVGAVVTSEKNPRASPCFFAMMILTAGI